MLALIVCQLLAGNDDALIMMSAPHREGYYASVYREIIDFQITFAKTILEGDDDVLILTDSDSYPLFLSELGADVLVENQIQQDIWMRDFTTVNPSNPVQFKYAPAAQGGDASAAEYVQSFFNTNIMESIPASTSWNLVSSDLVLDGGNFVDNHHNRAIVSKKIIEDSETKDIQVVKDRIKELIPMITEVAVIDYDDPNLGHADGMLMWINEDTLLVNNMSATPSLRTSVMDELTASFPTVTIIEVPSNYTPGTEFDSQFSSALGININTVMTDNYLYVPTFGDTATDKEFLSILSQHTSKQIKQIPAAAVAPMGGSCRCLTWQTSGDFANDILSHFKPTPEIDEDRTEAPSSSSHYTASFYLVVVFVFSFTFLF